MTIRLVVKLLFPKTESTEIQISDRLTETALAACSLLPQKGVTQLSELSALDVRVDCGNNAAILYDDQF